ncbi:MAG: cell wall hydrolase [Clostridia bacterium]|nr:cell wall hydrolase [Clostridia bacterium]
MKKKKLLFIFILIFLLNISTTFANNLKIVVDGKVVSGDVEPFILNGTTYVPLRFISNALKVDKITWNENSKSIIIEKDATRILLFINKNYAYVNNVYTSLNKTPLIFNLRTFVPLRTISDLFGSETQFNSDTYTITITTKKASLKSSSTSYKTTSTPTRKSNSKPTTTSTTISKPKNYTDDEVLWLARIIEAEAKGESYEGKVAVGNVILNRVKSENYPNTIWGVIFDTNYGVQFEPTENGTIYNAPSDESKKAAIAALTGKNIVGECLYFLNPKIAKSKWIIENRTFYKTIGNHDFYL